MIPGSAVDAFRDTLLRGRYRLLLGSGISINAKNATQKTLRSAEQLRIDLCRLRNVPDTTLSRITKGLSPTRTKSEITEHYKVTQTSLSHKLLSKFLWQDIFTFNVDDGIQVAYGHTVALVDHAGTGKSTIARRLAYDLADAGELVLYCVAISRINVKILFEVLNILDRAVVIVIDGLADHADSISAIQEDAEKWRHKVTVVGVERAYRKPQLDVHLSADTSQYEVVGALGLTEAAQLIDKFRKAGLVGKPNILKNSETIRGFSRELSREPIAVAACRVLNDFAGLERIVKSLWNAASAAERRVYLMAALAGHCYRTGVKYSILQVCNSSADIKNHFRSEHPLPLRYNSVDQDYIVPLNSVIGNTLVLETVSKNPAALFDTFQVLGDALAPYVNIQTISQGIPEARLAARLFDWDTVVRPLLGREGRNLYEHARRKWEWNSRYWEQKALMIEEDDLATAVQYARQAVAIEEHPFTLTTLGKLLMRAMEVERVRSGPYFTEAWTVLNKAINLEIVRHRSTIHPYMTLISGIPKFVRGGGNLSPIQMQTLRTYANDARYRYRRDPKMIAAIRRLDEVVDLN